MAACVLHGRVPRLRCFAGFRKRSVQAQLVRLKQEDETNREVKKVAVPPEEVSLQGAYRLYYNPRSYCSVLYSATSQSQTYECHSSLPPSLWQKSNCYSQSSSRHHSSSKNTLLDSAFNNGSEPEMGEAPLNHKNHILPDVKVDTRAFQKCRPGYASMTLDLTQRPHPIEWEEASQLLEEVTVLKGSMKPSDVSHFLVELSRLHPHQMSLVRNDQRFVMLLRYSVENLRLFTTLQLLEVLQSFAFLDLPPFHTALGVYEAELSSRANQMSLHQLLLAADMWRCLGRQVSHFLHHLYNLVHQHLGQMEVSELVQLIYIMGEHRHCPKALLQPVVQLLMLHLHQLHPEEVGTVCLAFFKTQTPIPQDAVTRIIDKALSVVEEMSDFAMVNVLKFLRFSYLYHREWLEAMAQEVPRRAHRMGVIGLMHVALACSSLHCRDDKILMAIAERVPLLAPHCRSKDSSKLLWAFGTLGYQPVQSTSFYSNLTEVLRQKKVELQRYPEHLLSGLLGLAFVSQFPEDLIALALSPEFVEIAQNYTQLDLKKDLFSLDGTVALELPQWTGPRLSSELRAEVTEMLWKFAQSDVCHKPEVQEAEAVLQELLGGEKFVHKRMILPHTRSIDLEVHLDSTGRPMHVNPASDAVTLSPKNNSLNVACHQNWGRMSTGVAISDELVSQLTNTKNRSKPLTPPPVVKPSVLRRVKPDEDGRLFDTELLLTRGTIEALTSPSSRGSGPQKPEGPVKLAIQVSNRNHYCYHSPQLLGFHALKRRQLKLAGYKVVEINYWEWFPMLRKSRVQKLAYLHSKIFDHL